MKIYLAGPEVFLPDAKAIGESKKRICARHGAEGLYPLDKDVEPFEPRADWAYTIFLANRGLMDRADAVVANMTPFRGVSMDVGTAFEMGYMNARRALVLGYSNVAGTYLERVREAGLAAADAALDRAGLTIEDFGLGDNLMLAGAVRASGFEVLAGARRRREGPALHSDLTLFERCVEIATEHWRRRAVDPSPRHVRSPEVIQAAGVIPKRIEEFVGRVSTKTGELSLARMKSPKGWVEPGQTPEFTEYTLVLAGTLRVASRSGSLDVRAGEAVVTRPGEWVQYSTPLEDSEYVAVCLPAFSPDTVHRDG
jgi:nucleoside 2-deoxyribosyltransferase/mannose-6-phosphate isomerase-like protein (cupin superfamily)